MYGKIKNHLIQLFKDERIIASRQGCGVKSN